MNTLLVTQINRKALAPTTNLPSALCLGRKLEDHHKLGPWLPAGGMCIKYCIC